MSMRYLAVLSMLLLAGCDYSLRIPFPKIEKNAQQSRLGSPLPDPTLQPSNPALGETVTITYTGLEPGYYYSLYLSYGTAGGGDMDKPKPGNVAPYYKVGNLVPVDKVASLSFEVRSVMGNDQNGAPFKLSHGQLVTLSLKGQPQDKPDSYFAQGGGSFLIQ
ncbi:MAG TPA: hypothetical protein V6D05_16360 [Stenomitos sp.]